MSERLSIRAYARHRGVSQTAVQNAIKAGRITKGDDGLIDVAAADAAWQRNTSPAPRSSGKKGVEGQVDHGTGRTAGSPPPSDQQSADAAGYAAARARKEMALAELREAELAEKLGQLIPIEYAAEQLSSVAQAIRAVLLNLPGKIAPQLAACETIPQAQKLLQTAIDEAMAELSKLGENEFLNGATASARGNSVAA